MEESSAMEPRPQPAKRPNGVQRVVILEKYLNSDFFSLSGSASKGSSSYSFILSYNAFEARYNASLKTVFFRRAGSSKGLLVLKTGTRKTNLSNGS
jgi:hypothetical protein